MLDVLYEDNHLLVVNKPALLPTMGVAEDRSSLLAVAKQYVRRKYNKPGNVYLGIVSRLDAPVTGVVLIARTSKAAGRLAEQFRDRQVEKTYWALVEGRAAVEDQKLVDYMRKDERHRRMHIAAKDAPGAQLAELSFRSLVTPRVSPKSAVSLIEVTPLTGRKHQIRVQLSQAGLPIVGDRKYGGSVQFSPGIALHSRRLVVDHPVSKMQIVFETPPPHSWQRFLEH
ncbi:MAG TPA: RluA family pseudouridine synthase [Lacipirellulaceae bacterium]|jgi:23S rRNA pseudouridine1911/1915/1917 synthase|nr:RluA family pseudouridine synthase [Lacipirellulaceae bacterium]